MEKWVKMPTGRIGDQGNPFLKKFIWQKQNKADQVAMLIIYLVLLHHSENGVSSISYMGLQGITGLSRAKISAGIKLLVENDMIEKDKSSQKNSYKIKSYDDVPWGKTPARGLYGKEDKTVNLLNKFTLRNKNELNALKLYYLVIAMRDSQSNCANMSYETITKYTGIIRNNIKSAISLLINLGLIQLESAWNQKSDYGVANQYRLTHVDTGKHRGTVGKNLIFN